MMSKLMQLPELYLRGSLANETMRYLAPDQKQVVDQLTTKLAKSQLIAGHRQEFVTRLSQTIGGDYRDHASSAEAEFYIAVWRAVVYVLYHTKYEFSCGACKAGEYQTQRGKPKAFDRRYPICPNCNKVKLLDPERYLDHDDLQSIAASGKPVPQHTSPILAKGTAEKKVANHGALLADENQLGKFMGEFIWNYFRQILQENKRIHHEKEPKDIYGPADRIAVDELLSLLVRHEIKYEYSENSNPHNGFYRVATDLFLTPPELNYHSDSTMAGELTLLVGKYADLGVPIKFTEHEVLVKYVGSKAKLVAASVVKPMLVCVSSSAQSIDEEEEDSSIFDVLSQDMIEGVSMLTEPDSIERIEAEDLVNTIRDSLPEGAKPVMDIYTGTGEIYRQFLLSTESKSANGTKITVGRIAKFLGKSQRQIDQYISDIKVQCLARGIVGVSD